MGEDDSLEVWGDDDWCGCTHDVACRRHKNMEA